MLNHLLQFVDNALITGQANFQPEKLYTIWILNLTQTIKNGFKNKQKTQVWRL